MSEPTHRRKRIGRSGALTAVVALLSFASQAQALTVNSLGDGSDVNLGNGTCATAGNVCTLRAAIQESDAQLGGNIDFSVNGTIDIGSELTFRYPLSINGPGPDDLTVRRDPDSASEFRIFHVNSAVSGPLGATFAGIKITNGVSRFPLFAGGSQGHGGAISTTGTVVLTIRDAAIVGNEARGENLAEGGGIWAGASQGGSVRILDSTIANNKAIGLRNPSRGEGTEGRGGGIYVNSKSLLIRGSTISGNETGAAPGFRGKTEGIPPAAASI